MSMTIDEARAIASGAEAHATVTYDCAESVLREHGDNAGAERAATLARAQRARDYATAPHATAEARPTLSGALDATGEVSGVTATAILRTMERAGLLPTATEFADLALAQLWRAEFGGWIMVPDDGRRAPVWFRFGMTPSAIWAHPFARGISGRLI